MEDSGDREIPDILLSYCHGTKTAGVPFFRGQGMPRTPSGNQPQGSSLFNVSWAINLHSTPGWVSPQMLQLSTIGSSTAREFHILFMSHSSNLTLIPFFLHPQCLVAMRYLLFPKSLKFNTGHPNRPGSRGQGRRLIRSSGAACGEGVVSWSQTRTIVTRPECSAHSFTFP